jgi:hypothetical protein
MNEALANYLLWVVTDPQRLAYFNNPTTRNAMIDESNLPEEDRAALRGNDVAALMARFAAGVGNTMWVLVPAPPGGFALGLGVMTPKPPTPPPPPPLTSSGRNIGPSVKTAKARKSAKSKAAKSRRKSKGKGRR